MFAGFKQFFVETEGVVINTVCKCEGPPVLLLRDSTQMLAMWHLVAPRLAEVVRRL